MKGMVGRKKQRENSNIAKEVTIGEELQHKNNSAGRIVQEEQCMKNNVKGTMQEEWCESCSMRGIM